MDMQWKRFEGLQGIEIDRVWAEQFNLFQEGKQWEFIFSEALVEYSKGDVFGYLRVTAEENEDGDDYLVIHTQDLPSPFAYSFEKEITNRPFIQASSIQLKKGQVVAVKESETVKGFGPATLTFEMEQGQLTFQAQAGCMINMKLT